MFGTDQQTNAASTANSAIASTLQRLTAALAQRSRVHLLAQLRLRLPRLAVLLSLGALLQPAVLHAAPRLRSLGLVPWDAAGGITPSQPSEANAQGPSALLHWKGRDWLLDTAGQRLVSVVDGLVEPLPAGWWEDALAHGDALWLLARLPTHAGQAPGVAFWQPGRAPLVWPLDSPETASALLPDPGGGWPWVEHLHRHAAPLAPLSATHGSHGLAVPSPVRPPLRLDRASGQQALKLRTKDGSDTLLRLPTPIRSIRDAGWHKGALWWVWDDRDGRRWFSEWPQQATRLTKAMAPTAARHTAVCKGLGPWQQLRVAHVHNGVVRVVCPLPAGVQVVEVTP